MIDPALLYALNIFFGNVCYQFVRLAPRDISDAVQLVGENMEDDIDLVVHIRHICGDLFGGGVGVVGKDGECICHAVKIGTEQLPRVVEICSKIWSTGL